MTKEDFKKFVEKVELAQECEEIASSVIAEMPTCIEDIEADKDDPIIFQMITSHIERLPMTDVQEWDNCLYWIDRSLHTAWQRIKSGIYDEAMGYWRRAYENAHKLQLAVYDSFTEILQ